MPKPEQSRANLPEVASVFLKLGIIGFGGPAAHIAMMEEEVVRRRKWISQEHFLDLLGATNLIPGPNSTEMAMHCGHERAGTRGLIVAGMCFIFPAVIITAILAYLYVRYGNLPAVEPFIYGIKPAIIGVVVSLMILLAKKAVKTVMLGILGIVAAALVLLGLNEIYVLFGGGFAGIIMNRIFTRKQSLHTFIPFILLQTTTQVATEFPWKIFWLFLKIGSILYGSGYVLFAFLDVELVDTGMLSKKELIDAIAVGQFTPGPVFSSATFIGWLLAGLPGAIAATIGIFLPSFLFVALLNPLIPKLRESKIMAAFLDAVNVVSVAIILAICVEMGRATIVDWRTVLIAVAGLLVSLLYRKVNSAFIVLGGALVGYLLSLI